MRLILAILILALFMACGLDPQYDFQTTSPKAHDPKDTSKKQGHDESKESQIFCKVQEIFDTNCIRCHKEGGEKPSLVRDSVQSLIARVTTALI